MKNQMRNEQLLQEYRPSFVKVCLGNTSDTVYGKKVTAEMHTKEYWLKIVDDAIEDLIKGNYINGKGLKNTVDYWEAQREMIEEYEFKKI